MRRLFEFVSTGVSQNWERMSGGETMILSSLNLSTGITFTSPESWFVSKSTVSS